MKSRTRKIPEMIPNELIENRIYLIRDEKVMLDRDLAELYGVKTSQLTRQVRRNLKRFPRDFMIRLNFKEFSDLKCRFGTSSWGGTRKLPFAFTENGVAMLSSVLNSERAVQVNIQIMRTFTRLRKLMASHKQILRKLTEHELELQYLNKSVVKIFEVINAIVDPPVEKKRRIGFLPPE